MATDRQHLDIQREEISSFAAAKDIHVDKMGHGSIRRESETAGTKVKTCSRTLEERGCLDRIGYYPFVSYLI